MTLLAEAAWFPSTPEEDEQTRNEGAMRLAVAEDAIVDEVDREHPRLQLAVLGAIARYSLLLMDAELAALPPGQDGPLVYLIPKGERERIEHLHEQHPADRKLKLRAYALITKLSQEATCDEVAWAACGAMLAFRWKPALWHCSGPGSSGTLVM